MHTIAIDTKVRAGRHVMGRVTGFVIDPRRSRVTNLAVRTHGLLPISHLYPLPDLTHDMHTRHDLLVGSPVGSTPDSAVAAGVGLATGGGGPMTPTRDNEVTFVPIGGWAHPQPDYDPGIVHVVGWPGGLGLGCSNSPVRSTDELDLVIDFDRLPKGEVELGSTSEVLDSARCLVGHVRSLTVAEDGTLVSIAVRRTAVWRPRHVDVPVAWVGRIVNDQVFLDVNRRVLTSP